MKIGLPNAILAATKQLYEWFSPSLCSYQRIIMEFPEVITNDRSDFHAKGQGQRLKVKVTEVKIQFNRFRTITPVWIHIWWWNYVESFMLFSRYVLLIFKVIRQILSSTGWKKSMIMTLIERFGPVTPVWIHPWLELMRGWRLGAFLRWCPPSTISVGPLIFHGHHRGCLNNPIFSNFGLCAACWAHFVCHHELWPTSVSHPFSSIAL